MRSFWSDPYLWVHLAGIAAVPLFLDLCLIGLATGEPLLPLWVELLLVGGIGILPVFWMQWQRPFSIFSLPLVALKPTRFTDDQRRIIHLFKSSLNRGLALLIAVGMAVLLWQLYQIAPLASPAPLFSSLSRGVGLLVAAIAFLGCNLFVQVPGSVLAVLLTSEAKFVATEPYPTGQISRDFTLPGIRVLHLLPPLISEPRPSATITAPPTPTVVTPDAEEDLENNRVSENWASANDLENQETSDSPITAVEVTGEFAIPEDFEEDEDYVTEEVEVILDEEAPEQDWNEEWNESETEPFIQFPEQAPEQDLQQAPIAESITEPSTESITESIAELEETISPVEPIASEEPANAELIEAEITEEITVEGIGEANLLIEADGVEEIEVNIETDNDVEIVIEADDLSSVEIQSREQIDESESVQIEEESSMSETIEFVDEFALDNESDNAKDNATQLMSKSDIVDRRERSTNVSALNQSQSFVSEEDATSNSDLSAATSEQNAETNENTPQSDSFPNQNRERTEDAIEITEDESVTETYSLEERSQSD
jgi:hypothetical protein